MRVWRGEWIQICSPSHAWTACDCSFDGGGSGDDASDGFAGDAGEDARISSDAAAVGDAESSRDADLASSDASVGDAGGVCVIDDGRLCHHRDHDNRPHCCPGYACTGATADPGDYTCERE